jgi:hypothetical protein
MNSVFRGIIVVRSKSNSRSGFSIVEVLISTLMITGIMVVMLDAMTTSQRGHRQVAIEAAFNNLSSGIAVAVGREELCTKTSMVGLPFNGTVPVHLTNITMTGTNLVQLGKFAPGVSVQDIRIDKVIGSALVDVHYREYLVNLAVEAVKTDEVALGRRKMTANMRMAVKVDTDTGLVVNCNSKPEGPSLAESCNAAGGIWNTTLAKCDLAKPVCERAGGVWIDASTTCDKSAMQYVVEVPNGTNGITTVNALCNAGDMATGGGGTSQNPVDLLKTSPVMSATKATGWTCTGQNLRMCRALCMKSMQASTL